MGSPPSQSNSDANVIGPENSFFALGGDSLTATQLAAMYSDVGINLGLARYLRLPYFGGTGVGELGRRNHVVETVKT